MSDHKLDPISKMTLFFVTAMSIIMLLQMGASLHKHDMFLLIQSGITVAFFVGLGILVLAQRFNELRNKIEARDRDIEAMRSNQTQNLAAPAPARPEMPQELKDLLKAVVEPVLEHKHDHETLDAIIEDTGGLPLTVDRIPAIEAAFHEKTDRYVKLELTADNEGIEVEFSAKPIVKPEPATKPTTGKSVNGVEKLTKSQQRRRNAAKGLGPKTDDEVREEKNRKRREARAAKKAAAEGGNTTTTTTTQPGQTSLV